jgi:hypothetical protein
VDQIPSFGISRSQSGIWPAESRSFLAGEPARTRLTVRIIIARAEGVATE